MLGVLVVLDIVDTAVRRWFSAHAFTTSALVSVLVLVITVLNVDQVVRRRQLRDRAKVTAAQAAILGRQARRATDQVRAAFTDASRRDSAGDELRTFMSMLLVSAPVLIDAAPARAFLEAAQRLGGLLAYAVAHADDGSASNLGPRLDAAVEAVDDAGRPLVSILDLAQRQAVDGDDGDGAAAQAAGSTSARS